MHADVDAGLLVYKRYSTLLNYVKYVWTTTELQAGFSMDLDAISHWVS